MIVVTYQLKTTPTKVALQIITGVNEEEEHEYFDEDEDEKPTSKITARVNNTKTSVRSPVLSVKVPIRA